MTTATLDRAPGPEVRPTPASARAAEDPVAGALRAALLADISAETAEWIAADLMRRSARGAEVFPAAAAAVRIRARADRHRADARKWRRQAGDLVLLSPQ